MIKLVLKCLLVVLVLKTVCFARAQEIDYATGVVITPQDDVYFSDSKWTIALFFDVDILIKTHNDLVTILKGLNTVYISHVTTFKPFEVDLAIKQVTDAVNNYGLEVMYFRRLIPTRSKRANFF